MFILAFAGRKRHKGKKLPRAIRVSRQQRPEAITLDVGWLVGLLSARGSGTRSISALSVSGPKSSSDILAAGPCRLRRRFLFHFIEFDAGRSTWCYPTLYASKAQVALEAITSRQNHRLRARNEMRRALNERVDFLDGLIKRWTSGATYIELSRSRFIRRWWLRAIAATERSISDFIRDFGTDVSNSPHLHATFKRLRQTALRPAIAASNIQWLDAEVARYPTIFGAMPRLRRDALTQSQARAAVCPEANTLVLAGAGTGKTSLSLRRVEYLAKSRQTRLQDVALLSFSKKAVGEIDERIGRDHDWLKPAFRSTLHSLGQSLITAYSGEKPRTSKLATGKREEDPEDPLHGWIFSEIGVMLADSATTEIVRDFIVAGLYQYRSDDQFENLSDYYDSLDKIRPRTLKGDWVKSIEECNAANFMFMNGVFYDYEEPYKEERLATAEFSQYTPDFFLPEYEGHYYEHFGLTADNRTRRDIDAAEYLRQREVKRNVHKRNGTTLIETTTGEFRERGVAAVLKAAFRAHGVTLRPLSAGEVLSALESHGARDRLVDLFATFLRKCRSKAISPADVRQRASGHLDPHRATTFAEIFGHLYARYEATLADKRQIDFDMMITEATRLLEDDSSFARIEGLCSYKYLIVDEYQDVTEIQIRFLKIFAKRCKAKLLVVGDDFQSIFAFSGAQRNAVQGFSSVMGDTASFTLDRSFRCDSGILELAKEFIEKNPGQLKKNIRPNAVVDGPTVFVLGEPRNDKVTQALFELAVSRANADATARGMIAPTIMVLARKAKKILPGERSLRKAAPTAKIDCRSIHGSKGSEADFVVVCDLVGDVYGFPDRRPQDDLFDLIELPESFDYAEERRLFYVALTRARHGVYLCVPWLDPSMFVDEIRNHSRVVIDDQTAPEPSTGIQCPRCKSGILELHWSRYSCTRWKYCKLKYPMCYINGCTGPMALRDGICACLFCGRRAPGCIRCRGFFLTRYNGKTDTFFESCSNGDPRYKGFPGNCSITRPLRPGLRAWRAVAPESA